METVVSWGSELHLIITENQINILLFEIYFKFELALFCLFIGEVVLWDSLFDDNFKNQTYEKSNYYLDSEWLLAR
jgi:hypothetical protein